MLAEDTWIFKMKRPFEDEGFGPIMNYDSRAKEFGSRPKLQAFCAIAPKCYEVGGCQNYGPFLDPFFFRHPIYGVPQKGS